MTRRWLIGLGLLLLLGAAPARAAELVVIDSSDPSLAPGTVLDGSLPLALASGARITLIGADGRIFSLDGPFDGTPAPGGEDGGGLVTALSRLINDSAQETTLLGAVRANTGSDPWRIDVGYDGHQCVTGEAVRLWRSRAGNATRLILKQVAGVRVVLDWPAGEATIPWPAAVPIADGGVYLMRLEGVSLPRKLVLHRLAGGYATDEAAALALAGKGCEDQAMSLLGTLRTGGN